jgi:parallel beta-helix repeat protein
MTRKLSVRIGVIAALLIAAAALLLSAQYALASHPSGPAGYWSFDDEADPTADLSGHGNNGDVNGGAVFTGTGIAPTPGNASAITFDGADDYVEITHDGDLDMTSEYSLSAWVNVADFATYRPILVRGATDENDIEVYVQVGTNDLIVAHNRGNGGTFDFVGFEDPPTGLFHLTVTYDGTDVKAYYDGVAGIVVQGTTAVEEPEDTDGVWWIGKVDHSGFGGSFFFKGLIDEVQIYDRVFTASEIEVLSNTGNTLFVSSDGQIGFGSIDCDGVGVGAYSTIQSAVDAASPGDSVYVCPGAYDEQVVIDGKDLTLQGAGDTTVVQPSSPATLTALYTYPVGVLSGWSGLNLAGVILVKNAGAVVVQNIKIDGANVVSLPVGAQRLSGIIYGEAGGLISDVTLNTIKTAGYADRTYVIDASAVSSERSIEITSTTINDYARTAIQAQGASLTANIHNNDITGPGAIGPANVPNGIVFIQNAVGAASSNVIRALHYTGASSLSAGLMAYEATGVAGVLFQNNEVYDTDDAVILASNSTNITVEGNNLHDNVKGIRIEGGAGGNSISKNLIDDNTSFGIDIDDDPATPGNVATRNSITGNGTGVSNPNVSNFDATCNWWGTLNGPGPVGPGSGDTVSANVDFTSWLTTADLTGPCNGPITRLTIIKSVINDNGGTKVVGDFPLFIDGFSVMSGVASTTSVGAHTVSETPQAGYTAGVWSGDCATDGTITLAPGQVATCTITNDDNEPSLTLQKVVVNNNGGTAMTADWTVTATGPTGFSGSGPIVPNGASFDAGTYNLSESGPAGYTASAWVCIGGNQTDGDTVVIGLGENVLCTITNDDNPPPTPPPPANACSNLLVAPAGYTLQNGTKASDTVTIAPFTMFVGKGGNDTVNGPAAGNYIVCTDKGNDIITLGNGDFTIHAGNGNNIVITGNGNGVITTLQANDKVTTGNGVQTINAGNGNNTILTGDGNKTITTGAAIDKITTGAGDDVINAGGGINTVKSGAGNDTITTGSSNDNIDAGPDNDTCNAGGGINVVINCAP